jgi:MFS family permease
LFSVSAVASAVAPDYTTLVAARMLGGLGVGAALIIAPMYIAELSAPEVRGRMVSFNQLNIVIGISAAYFSNYLILHLGQSDLAWAEALRLGEWNWRWMLGVEALPAIFYFIALFFVPESPRWLIMHGRESESLDILSRANGPERAATAIEDVKAMLRAEAGEARGTLRELFAPAMKLVLTIGVAVAILQQITGINAVFFYAPMIFEQSGVGTDASFMQAVLVGLVNLVFTVLAIMTIDKLGRRPLLLFGLTVIAACMFLLAYGFGSATYTLTPEALAALPATFDAAALQPLLGETFQSDVAFREALTGAIGREAMTVHQATLVSGAISMNPTLILLAILGFVAGFAISLGPVMWVLFSELFPNRVRGIAISFVGLINSAISFLVQLVFPWELENLGNSTTFLIYGIFAVIGLIIVWRLLPETKGKSLEQLEAQLVHKP